MEEVRRATPADLVACRELVSRALGDVDEAVVADLLHRPDLGTGPGPGAETVERPALVGRYHGAVVGVALAHWDHDRGGPAVLELCYVEPGAREVGVGGALLRAVVEWADEQGADGVQAVAGPGDRSTKRLLEAAGFKTRLLVLHRRGDERRDPHPPVP